MGIWGAERETGIAHGCEDNGDAHHALVGDRTLIAIGRGRVVALAERGSARRPYVFTKGSLVWNDAGDITHSLKAASLRKEVDDSL